MQNLFLTKIVADDAGHKNTVIGWYKQGRKYAYLTIITYDVASESESTPCNKIDKPLVVYTFSGNVNDVHNNVAYIITKLYLFFNARNEISKKS